MMFTQEQINEIKQRLSLSGIKDSELDKLNLLEHPLTGKEVIVIVKDGENLRISVEDLYEEFAKYIEQSENKEDFFNVSVYLGRLDPEFENAAKPCTLEEAINACPPYIRRAGQMISFLDSHNMKWETYQYIGTESDNWEDGTLFENYNQVLQDQIDNLTDKAYDPTDYSGLGRITLSKNVKVIDDATANYLEQSMMTAENTIYIIRYDFTLGEDIVVPENCVLKFEGGSLSGGSIELQNTEIINGNNALLCTLSGTVKNRRVCIDWVMESNVIDTSNVARISSLWSINCAEYEFTNKSYNQSTPLLIPSDKGTLKLYGNDATIIGTSVVSSKYSIQFKDHAGGNVYIENLNFSGYRITIFGSNSTFGSFEINGFNSSNNIHAFKLQHCEVGDLIIKNVDISSCELGIVTNTNVNINSIYLSNIKVRDMAINEEITPQQRDSDGALADVPYLGGINISPYNTQNKQSAIIENILVENCVIKANLLEDYNDTIITGCRVTLNHSIQGTSIVANNIIVRNWDISEANYKIGSGCYFGSYTSTLSNIIIYDAGGDEAMMSIKRHNNLNVVNCNFEMSETYRSYLSTHLGQGIITTAPYSRIHGCTFRGINGAGIRGYASYVHLSYNKFYECRTAYTDAGGSYSDLKEIHLDNCLLLDTFGIFYQQNNGLDTKETKIYINNCKIYNVSDFYAQLDHIKAVYITNNIIEVNPEVTGYIGSLNKNDTTAECNILLFKDNVFRNTNRANTSAFIGQYTTAKQIIVKNNVISGGFIKMASSATSLRASIQEFVIADNVIDNTTEVIRFYSTIPTSELGRKVLAIYNNVGYDYTPTRVSGATNLRPLSGRVGQSYYDTTLKKLLFISEITESEETVEVTWVDALGNPVETVYPKVLGTPVTGNLAAFNGTDIEDSNTNSIVNGE